MSCLHRQNLGGSGTCRTFVSLQPQNNLGGNFFKNVKMLKLYVQHLSIISFFQIVSQFSNFEEVEKQLVGLRRAAPQAKI